MNWYNGATGECVGTEGLNSTSGNAESSPSQQPVFVLPALSGPPLLGTYDAMTDELWRWKRRRAFLRATEVMSVADKWALCGYTETILRWPERAKYFGGRF